MSPEIISSPQNPRIKRLRRLSTGKDPDEEWFLLEGRSVIREALGRGWELEAIYHTAGKGIPTAATTSLQVSEKVMQSVSTLDQSPGILAVARKHYARMEEISLKGRSLLLAGIQDPGNLGALLRSAAAFGVSTVLSSPGTAHFYNPKVVRAAMGAMFQLQLCENVKAGDLATLLDENQAELIVADSGSGEDPRSLSRQGKYVLALGHETLGVSREFRALAKRQVRIPISSATQSLNVAVAGSILLYELA
jgi:TrmH family RNA methyltransferase